MSLIKIFTFIMTCLAVNFMLVAGECQTPTTPPGHLEYERIQALWYDLYVTQPVLDVSRHIVYKFTIEGAVIKLYGTQENKQSDESYVPGKFEGEFDIPEHGDPRVTVRLGEPLAGFNATYTIITDYDCYLIMIGCLESLNQDSASIAFKVEDPPKECVDAAFTAFEQAGLDPNTMIEDKSFNS